MKKRLPIVALLLAILIITSCGDKTDSATIFKDTNGDATFTFTFNENGTWTHRYCDTVSDFFNQAGTYTGNPKIDGIIVLFQTKEVPLSILQNLESTSTPITTENAPLEQIPQSQQYPYEFSITNGSFTMGPRTYTRQ